MGKIAIVIVSKLLQAGVSSLLADEFEIVAAGAELVLVEVRDDLDAVLAPHPGAVLVLLAQPGCPCEALKRLYWGRPEVRACVMVTAGYALLSATLRLVLAGGETAPAELVRQRVDVHGSARHGLSPRERVVLDQITLGKSNKVIARDLECRESTVKVHVKAVLRKLGLANRTQAAVWAREQVVMLPNGEDTS